MSVELRTWDNNENWDGEVHHQRYIQMIVPNRYDFYDHNLIFFSIEKNAMKLEAALEAYEAVKLAQDLMEWLKKMPNSSIGRNTTSWDFVNSFIPVVERKQPVYDFEQTG